MRQSRGVYTFVPSPDNVKKKRSEALIGAIPKCGRVSGIENEFRIMYTHLIALWPTIHTDIDCRYVFLCEIQGVQKNKRTTLDFFLLTRSGTFCFQHVST